MATSPGNPVRKLIALAEKEFRQVRTVRHEATPQRTIVALASWYGRFEVRITQVRGPSWRRYSYYIWDGPALVVGFDNAADRPAIRLEYGDDWQTHIHERIPHRHGPDAGELALTAEMTCEAFIIWLKENLPPLVPDHIPAQGRGL